MKEIPQSFAQALAQSQREVVHAIVVVLAVSAANFRFVALDHAINLDLRDGNGEVRFEAMPFSLGAISLQADLQVDQTTISFPNVEMLLQFSSQVQRVSLADLVLNGVLDMSSFTVWMANQENGATYRHSVWDMVGAPEVSRSVVTLQLQSALGRCARKMPRTLVQEGCNNGLYDDYCTLLEASYMATGTTTGCVTGQERTSMTTALGAADDYYALGRVLFVSGPNVGAWRTIGYHKNSGGTVKWARPLRYDVEAGHLFEIVPGCDKSFAACMDKYANQQHFRGFPNVPYPEVML